ncbi:MAG TPA: translation initiation factor IF-2 [Polyangiaceae bacterium]|jgi:translation initiation factor IF-2|nr:translation initiation factor IF-2 [Polyangiaceae bacterium]
MTAKLRVYEVARDLGMDQKALVALLQSSGVPDVRNHMSSIGPDVVERIRRQLEKQKAPSVVEERIHATVVKRRAARPPTPPPGAVAASTAPAASAPPVPSAPAASAPMAAAPPAPRSEPIAAPAVIKRSKAPASTPMKEAPSAPAAAAPPSPAPVAPREPSPPPVAAAPPPPPAVVEAPKAAPPPPPAAAPAAPVAVAPPAPAAAPAPPPAAAVPAVAAAAPAPAAPAAAAPGPAASAAAPAKPAPAPAAAAPARPATPRTGIDVWEGRPGVPMPQVQRSPTPRRVQYDPKAGAANARPRPGGPFMGGRPGFGRPGMRRPGMGGLSSLPRTKGPIATQERGAHKKIVRIEESVSLQTLAGRMQIKATEVLMKLMRLGTTGVNINSTLDADTAKIVANEFGWEVEDTAVSEADQLTAARGTSPEEIGTVARPPIVTVMGHVDHGKTSLLDKIRKANVVAGEAGGITQHVGAYSVETPRGPITFLDTPGHEAFTAMRARGAQATDIVVLVVAADDGVMPQTKEAVNHAKAANVPVVVAVNKIDKPDANSERVKRQLAEIGLTPEDWGGETLYTEVSAHTGQGIDTLLEQILLQAEVLELRSNPAGPASGIVIEAELDRGRGPVATVLIMDGTLNRGDVVLAGGAYGKVRAMSDSHDRLVNEAGPATPVVLIGLNDVPSAGDQVHVVTDLKKAQEIAETRKTKERRSLVPSTGQKAMSLEDLHKALQEVEQLELKLIIKADVQGSVEAVADALTRLTSEKVRVSVVHSAAGAITEGDVNLAVAAGAIIIGFNVRPAGKAALLAQKEGVQIRPYSIIYNVVDEVKAAMEGLLAPTQVEKFQGKAEVRQVFRISKAGIVAGCMIIEGLVKRSSNARLVREGAEIWSGKLSSLKRFKDDVREVKEGFDCGIALEGYDEVKVGDIIQAYEIESVKQTL